MGMRISTNVSSITAQRTLRNSQNEIAKSFGQLSTGSRITKSADDAAGLAVSEILKGRIRGFRQASRNANDAISLLQTSEGGLQEISNVIVRLRELGVQAASDTVGQRERLMINTEVQQLVAEADRIAKTTSFASTQLLDGTGDQFQFQIGVEAGENSRIVFNAGDQNATTAALEIDGIDYSSREGAREALTKLDEASIRVNKTRADLGAMQSRMNSTIANLGVQDENLSAANSRIRDADIAKSTAELTRNNILLQAGTSTLAQANQMGNLALQLIG